MQVQFRDKAIWEGTKKPNYAGSWISAPQQLKKS